MRIFDAQVQDGRLMLNESTDASDRTVVQLVSIDDVIDEILAQGETADRIALHLELVASEHEIETGRGMDLSDVLTRLRAERHSSEGQ
jgi:hypothetical protein